jgi:hypothetical protein
MLLWQDRGWEPPAADDPPPQAGGARGARGARSWHLPWRSLAWFAACCWLMALVPIVTDALGGLAGYGVVLAAVALVAWRIDRWCARQYWQGLREYRQ